MRAGWLRKEFGADTFGGSDFAQSEQQVETEETNAGGGYPPEWLLEQMAAGQSWRWRAVGRVRLSVCSRTQRSRVRHIATGHLNRVRFSGSSHTRTQAHESTSPAVAARVTSADRQQRNEAATGKTRMVGEALATMSRRHVARGFARRPDNTAALLLLGD